MTGFLCGFSKRLPNSDSFNPFSGIPVKSTPLKKYQAGDFAAIQRYTVTAIFNRVVQWGAMASQWMGYKQIREQRQGSKSAIFHNWFGIAQVDDQELPSITNCNSSEVDNECGIMYERAELPTGEAGVRIHEVIS